MMETAPSTSALDYEIIPFVEAVCIDGELTEVHPDNMIVDSIQFNNETATLVAAAVVADNASPSRSSGCSCTSHRISGNCGCRDNSRPEEEEVGSLTSVSPSQEFQLRTSFHQDQQQLMASSHHSSVGGDNNNDDDGGDESQVLGAGAAGAVLGFLMGGPFLCVVLGLGSLYCSQLEGAAGDIARAMGDVALLTQSKFLELDEKHHLVDKGREAAGKALSKLKEAEERRRRHRSCKKEIKFRKFVAWCWKALVDFEIKHKLLRRISRNAKEHLDALVEQYLPNECQVDSRVQNQSSDDPSQQ
jgi:hypothetical protein